jgi:uncharacterized membrane protein YkvA (DUF1232 family)
VSTNDEVTVRRRRGFSAVPVFGDFLALARLVRDAAQPAWLKVFVAIALVYVVSPVDAMPEFVAPLVGWLDDLGLLLVLRVGLSRRLEPYRYPLLGSPEQAPITVSEVHERAGGAAERASLPSMR